MAGETKCERETEAKQDRRGGPSLSAETPEERSIDLPETVNRVYIPAALRANREAMMRMRF